MVLYGVMRRDYASTSNDVKGSPIPIQLLILHRLLALVVLSLLQKSGAQKNQLLDLAVVGTLHKIKHWNLTNKNYTIKVTSNLLGSEPASNM